MRKIFGLLSLIAICMVAFTSQASEIVDTDAPSIVYKVKAEKADIASLKIEATSHNFMYVNTEPVNAECCLADDASIYRNDIPIDDRIFNKESICFNDRNFAEPIPDSSVSNKGKPTLKNGYRCPDLTKDITTNVGKFTNTFS